MRFRVEGLGFRGETIKALIPGVPQTGAGCHSPARKPCQGNFRGFLGHLRGLLVVSQGPLEVAVGMIEGYFKAFCRSLE